MWLPRFVAVNKDITMYVGYVRALSGFLRSGSWLGKLGIKTRSKQSNQR